MPDSISVSDMDALYNRLEKKVNVDRQLEISEALRTRRTFDGKNKDGSPKFKMRILPQTGSWNWGGQEALAREIAEESKRKESIKRARTEKSLRRLKTEAMTSETIKSAEERLSEIISERERGYRQIRDNIFTMSESQLDSIKIDRKFLGNTYANSLERAIKGRKEELRGV